MNVLYSGDPVSASTDLDVQNLMGAVVNQARKLLLKDSTNANTTNDEPALLENLLQHLQCSVDRFPVLTHVHHPNLQCQALVIQWNEDKDNETEEAHDSHDTQSSAAAKPQQKHINAVLKIRMPCQESALLWMPWLPYQAQPSHNNPAAYFHSIQIAGRPAVQARATRCYDHSYAYSGQTHPIEATTPPGVRQLYRHVNAMFGLVKDKNENEDVGVNMCLENDYRNGHNSISEHSDDERAFGNLHDVYCFLTGPASREGVFCVRKTASKLATKADLMKLQSDPTDRQVLGIQLPTGLYVMQGRAFQGRYTHAFPPIHEHLFRRICNAEASLQKHQRGQILPGFPDEPDKEMEKLYGKHSLRQAAWIQDRADLVRQQTLAGHFATTPRHRVQTTPAQDAAALDEWCLWRTSYTLRNFQVEPAERKKRQKTCGEPSY